MNFLISIFSISIETRIVALVIAIIDDVLFSTTLFLETRIKIIENKRKSICVTTFSEIIKRRERKLIIARIVTITTKIAIIDNLIARERISLSSKSLVSNIRRFSIFSRIELSLENRKFIFKFILESAPSNSLRHNI